MPNRENDWNFSIFHREINSQNFKDFIFSILPTQGSVELQNDSPGKEFHWHSHETDETLFILDGKILFYWENGEKICEPGDIICLPRGMRHGSKALENGAKYVIAMFRAVGSQ
ncbi:MAG: cupin domain-containing protein [Salinarimonas sp.]